METSVLLQSQELKRTKRLFLRDKDRLERQIAESEGEIEKRDRRQMDADELEAKESVQLMMKEQELRSEIADLKLKMMGKDKILEKYVRASGAESPLRELNFPSRLLRSRAGTKPSWTRSGGARPPPPTTGRPPARTRRP